MKLTYHGQTHFEDNLKLRLLVLTLTFNVKGESVVPWFPLILGFNLANAILWPLVAIWALKLLGMPVVYSFESWLGIWVLYGFARFFADESRESKT